MLDESGILEDGESPLEEHVFAIKRVLRVAEASDSVDCLQSAEGALRSAHHIDTRVSAVEVLLDRLPDGSSPRIQEAIGELKEALPHILNGSELPVELQYDLLRAESVLARRLLKIMKPEHVGDIADADSRENLLRRNVLAAVSSEDTRAQLETLGLHEGVVNDIDKRVSAQIHGFFVEANPGFFTDLEQQNLRPSFNFRADHLQGFSLLSADQLEEAQDQGLLKTYLSFIWNIIDALPEGPEIALWREGYDPLPLRKQKKFKAFMDERGMSVFESSTLVNAYTNRSGKRHSLRRHVRQSLVGETDREREVFRESRNRLVDYRNALLLELEPAELRDLVARHCAREKFGLIEAIDDLRLS